MARPDSAPSAGVSLPWSQRFLGIGTAAPPQPWTPASAAPSHHCSAGPGGTWQDMSATRRCNTCAGPIGHLQACCQPTCACCTTACATTTVLACLAARRPVHKRSSTGRLDGASHVSRRRRGGLTGTRKPTTASQPRAGLPQTQRRGGHGAPAIAHSGSAAVREALAHPCMHRPQSLESLCHARDGRRT